MAAAAMMALVCFVSSNPSPQHWVISGRTEAVARMDALVATLPDIRRIAHAQDGDTGFSRYAMGANPSNAILYPLIAHANDDRLVYSRFEHIVPSCPSGERSEVGDGRSGFTIALIGPNAAIDRLGIPLGAAAEPVRLDDGRTGLGLALGAIDRDVYDMLVRRAAQGTLPGLDLVLLRPGDDPPREPGPARRTGLDHLGS